MVKKFKLQITAVLCACALLVSGFVLSGAISSANNGSAVSAASNVQHSVAQFASAKATLTSTLDLTGKTESEDKLSSDGWKWEYSAAGSKLTLDGLNLTVTEHQALLLPGNTEIILVAGSENSIINGDSVGEWSVDNGAILSKGNLTISGSGKLTINAGTAASKYSTVYGIRAGESDSGSDLVIKGNVDISIVSGAQKQGAPKAKIIGIGAGKVTIEGNAVVANEMILSPDSWLAESSNTSIDATNVYIRGNTQVNISCKGQRATTGIRAKGAVEIGESAKVNINFDGEYILSQAIVGVSMKIYGGEVNIVLSCHEETEAAVGLFSNGSTFDYSGGNISIEIKNIQAAPIERLTAGCIVLTSDVNFSDTLFYVMNGNKATKVDVHMKELTLNGVSNGFVLAGTDGKIIGRISMTKDFSILDSGLPIGAIIGIIIGSVVVALVLVYFAGYFFLYKSSKLDGKKLAGIYKFLPKSKG